LATRSGDAINRQVRSNNLTVNAGTLRVIPNGLGPGVSKVAALTVAGGAKLDITNNKLITTTDVATVTGLIASGRNGGNWSGSGIVTSQSSATTSNFTSLGVASAQQVKGLANPSDTAVFAGQTVTGSDTLVMYTYGGDANLSGNVDVDDYGQIDFNSSTGGVLGGYYNGDFDYNGWVDVDDYGVIDFTVNIQGAPITSAPIALTSVPEPGAVGMDVSA